MFLWESGRANGVRYVVKSGDHADPVLGGDKRAATVRGFLINVKMGFVWYRLGHQDVCSTFIRRKQIYHIWAFAQDTG